MSTKIKDPAMDHSSLPISPVSIGYSRNMVKTRNNHMKFLKKRNNDLSVMRDSNFLYAKGYLVILLLLLPALSFAGVKDSTITDTITFYGDIRMQVLLRGDTVMMSDNQFRSLTKLVRSLNDERSIAEEQIQEMGRIVQRGERIVEEYKILVDLSEKQYENVKKEYNTMVELYGQQRQLTMELNDDRRFKNRQMAWKGVLWGVLAGFVAGAITIAITN